MTRHLNDEAAREQFGVWLVAQRNNARRTYEQLESEPGIRPYLELSRELEHVRGRYEAFQEALDALELDNEPGALEHRAAARPAWLYPA